MMSGDEEVTDDDSDYASSDNDQNDSDEDDKYARNSTDNGQDGANNGKNGGSHHASSGAERAENKGEFTNNIFFDGQNQVLTHDSDQQHHQKGSCTCRSRHVQTQGTYLANRLKVADDYSRKPAAHTGEGITCPKDDTGCQDSAVEGRSDVEERRP
jgi:hypothetical protein